MANEQLQKATEETEENNYVAKGDLKRGEVPVTTYMPFRLIVPLVLVVSLFFTGCTRPPALTGTNQVFVTSGSADDDADDQTTSPAVPYVDPNRSATDGQAVAVSDSQSFRSLRGNVTAKTGPHLSVFLP